MQPPTKHRPDAARLLHAVQVQHGPAQWSKEKRRLMHEFERSGDTTKHLLAHQRLTEAILKWERQSEF